MKRCARRRDNRPFWVATRTYVASCPAGAQGDPVSVTVQAESRISLEHAKTLALHQAECQARAKLKCQWCATESAIGSFQRVETVTACSTVSLQDARQKAIALAAEHAAQFSATVEATASCPMGMTGAPVTVSRTAYSSISQSDAIAKAAALSLAEAQAALVCAP